MKKLLSFFSKAQKTPKTKGFTLIEILVVIGIIAVLAAIVIVAINPARQFAQARNTQRTSNVQTILNAMGQNLADNKGIFTCLGSGTITSSAKNIGTGSGNIDLGCLVPTYISSAIPQDPGGSGLTTGTAADTQYTVLIDSAGRYTIAAPNAELSQTISLTR
jgi:prepilin-type N-terminal cleavage/methylation domain-containing protein